jgi:hypothetical protein
MNTIFMLCETAQVLSALRPLMPCRTVGEDTPA